MLIPWNMKKGKSIIKRLLILLIFLPGLNAKVFNQNNYELLYLNNDFEKIVSCAKNKSTIDDYYWLSLIFNKQGKTLIAINTLEEGIKKFENNQKLELQISNLYYETGNYAKAKPYLEKYLIYPEIFIQYINILEFQENHSLAIKLLNDKLPNDSMNIQLLTHLGENYYQIDSIELALTYFDKVFAQNPQDQSTAKILASLFIETKDFYRSINVCDTILRYDSTNQKFIKTKGIASFYKKDFKTAAICFDYLYKKGDSSKFIYKHHGICEFNNSKFKTSREHLIKAFKLDSNDYETCFFLGKAFLNSPTPEKGLYFLNRVDSLLQPDPLTISILYAEKQSIYSAINNYKDALECYTLAYKYNPKPEYLFFIASMYQNNLNNKKKALEYYNLFLENLPPKPDSEHKYEEDQITISLRKIAERNIVNLKEELFFNGELPK